MPGLDKLRRILSRDGKTYKDKDLILGVLSHYLEQIEGMGDEHAANNTRSLMKKAQSRFSEHMRGDLE